MSPLAISGIVLFCIFGSALLGVVLRTRFPDGHLTVETKDVVRLVMGTVGTMTGMVLGLLVASAKSSFDSQRDGVAELAANIVVLDRALEHFGPEAKDVRETLHESAEDILGRIWPEEHARAGGPLLASERNARYDDLYDQILALQPQNEVQRSPHALALKIMHDTAHLRWRLYSQQSSSLPPVFLVLMVAWMSITFASYGLFAPRHGTTLGVLFLGALVVSSAVFLILELVHSFGGLIHISSQPMLNAISQLGT